MAMNSSLANPELLNAMQAYFQGEKTEALVFILPIGLLSLVFGAWLWTDSTGGFMRGVAIPFLAMGLLMGTVGGVVGYRTPGQAARLEQSLQQSPDSARTTVQAESATRTARTSAPATMIESRTVSRWISVSSLPGSQRVRMRLA